jgi:hypothetical protein
LIDSIASLNAINSPVRRIRAAVVHTGATAAQIFYNTDRLISFSIERVGEAKFFGFGICQKANIKLIDKDRELSFTTDDTFRVEYNASGEYEYAHPEFRVTEVHRDENTNQLSITAYDKI